MTAGDVFFGAVAIVILLSFVAALSAHDWASVLVLTGVGSALPYLRHAARDRRRW